MCYNLIERLFEKKGAVILMKEYYYRLKNPITHKYFCKSADQVDEADKSEALVYKSETAQKILHDANFMGKIFVATKEQLKSSNIDNVKFPGYELVDVGLDDIRLPPKWKRIIERNAKIDHVSYEESKEDFCKRLVEFWSRWAEYNPFGDKPMPTYPSPFE